MASPTQGPPPAIEISHEPTTSPPEPTNQAYLPYRSHSNPVGARDHVHQHQRQPSNNALERTQESEGGSRRSSERPRAASGKDRQEANGSRRPSHTTRICGKCEGQLTGQFVRALENTYHLECFTCNDCGKIVASKFFPVPDQPPNQYPLCEVDYFKRLDLICFKCDGALRGSYITALDRKYHIEHFTCSICPTVFGAQDSYYEHDGSVYCHYHYSTRFAQRCNGCQTAILKQFVEIYRNGQNQHWHPECYMIHKYWNVRLHSPGQPITERASVEGDASESERKKVKSEEEAIEEKVLWIWRTLSAYEERSATCISDMLLHVSNGAYMEGVLSAKSFIVHIDLLFTAADNLDYIMSTQTPKGLSYSREAKLLCKKVVAFFSLLAESQETGVRRLGVTQELLSLVTGLAHYLKLLIRICLQGALKLEREISNDRGLHDFLHRINDLEAKLEAEDGRETSAELAAYVDESSDTCPLCTRPVEDRCFRWKDRVFHTTCLRCDSCQKDLSFESENASWYEKDNALICNACAGGRADDVEGQFLAVTRLQQYVHLLRVAHARLLATLKTSGALPHTSDDPNLDKYDAQSGCRTPVVNDSTNPLLLRSDTRSKSYGGSTSNSERPPSTSYEQALGDIKRLRSTRMNNEVHDTNRKSRLIESPERDPSGAKDGQKQGFHVLAKNDVANDSVSRQLNLGNAQINLDDIPRLVAAEQAREQRPNANKYARGGLVAQEPKPRIVSTHRRDQSGGQELDKLGPEGYRPKKYFSELSPIEYFIVRHVAVLSMEQLLEGHFNQEELLDLIETRKPTFWGKFGKAFKTDKKKNKGVFGVALESLIEKDGAESTDGVGPGALRVPALIQDAISAMRTMDMSMEGVFRKNGNIRRLKEMADTINEKGGDACDLNVENPVQVAALLKKFLRELPDPVLTFKLHRLFITSQKIADEEKRRRILHLSCCLLPKAHRDTMEVLFCFLNWAASFSVVDEESGSKMDIHNLATVIAPNILFSKEKVNTGDNSMEDSFLAIEAVHCLIQCNEEMCEVPEDLQSILNDSSLFSGSADITTKEILKRYADVASWKPSASTSSAPNNNFNAPQDSAGVASPFLDNVSASPTLPQLNQYTTTPAIRQTPPSALDNAGVRSPSQNSTSIIHPASNPSITNVNSNNTYGVRGAVEASATRPTLNGNPNMIGSFYAQPAGGDMSSREDITGQAHTYGLGVSQGTNGGRSASPARFLGHGA